MRPLFDPDEILVARAAHTAFRRQVEIHGWQVAYWTTEYREFVRASGAAWPSGFWDAVSSYDRTGLETALRFLEEDPVFFRSGYAKAWVLRRLPRWPLDEEVRHRIALVVLRAVNGPPRREFRWQAKAARLADRAVLVPNLLLRLDAGGTTAWQAFCAAHCLLGGGFPTWEQRHADPTPQIEAMRKRLEP